MDSTESIYLRNLAKKNRIKEQQAQAEVSQDAKAGLKEQGPQALQRESLRILRIERMYIQETRLLKYLEITDSQSTRFLLLFLKQVSTKSLLYAGHCGKQFTVISDLISTTLGSRNYHLGLFVHNRRHCTDISVHRLLLPVSSFLSSLPTLIITDPTRSPTFGFHASVKYQISGANFCERG